jgi:hypothetical protein
MFKKSFIKLSLFLLLASLNACIYLDATMPLDKDLDRTELGSKTGRASIYCVLWLVAWGDSGNKAAAENGHITTIYHADKHVYSVFFGVYTKETTIVYGD